jgi:hypothetical protein
VNKEAIVNKEAFVNNAALGTAEQILSYPFDKLKFVGHLRSLTALHLLDYRGRRHALDKRQ